MFKIHSFNLGLFFLLLIFFPSTNCIVHRISTKQRKLSAEISRFRLHERAEKIRQKLGLALDEPSFSQFKLDTKHQSIVEKDAGGEILINATTTSQIPIFVGNISIGTPPQIFSVEVDYFWGGELSVFGSRVNTSNWDTKMAIYPPWHTYNTSASSSYNRLPGDFSDDYAVIDDYGDPHFYHLSGHTGSDVIHLDGLNLTNVPMGIIDSAPLHNDVFYFPTDATLGLADEDPDIDTHLNDSFVKLISPQLDKPVVCLWSNRTLTDDHCGEAQITIGAEDIDNCETDWVYVPTLENHPFFTKVTNASAIAANGTLLATTETNQTVSGVIIITDIVTWLMAPRSVYELMVNASGAIWDSYYVGRHIVCDYAACEDCREDKMSQLGSVYVSVDNTTDNQIVIRPADYIDNYFSPSYQRNICVISVDVWNEERGYQPIVLGAKYLNNHCISRNIHTGDIVFATSKNQKLDMYQSTTSKQTMGTNGGTTQPSGAPTAIPTTTMRPPGSTTDSDISDYHYD